MDLERLNNQGSGDGASRSPRKDFFYGIAIDTHGDGSLCKPLEAAGEQTAPKKVVFSFRKRARPASDCQALSNSLSDILVIQGTGRGVRC